MVILPDEAERRLRLRPRELEGALVTDQARLEMHDV
jgi:hypothetical protein